MIITFLWAFNTRWTRTRSGPNSEAGILYAAAADRLSALDYDMVSDQINIIGQRIGGD